MKNFFETIKGGDIDQVISERNKLAIDVTTLVNEANANQTVMFSAVLIKDESQALAMLKIFVGMGV